MPRYLYGMRHQRGFGPGCQPARGLIGREDDPAGRYNDVLVYDRELEPHEIDSYELDFMGVEPDTTTHDSIVVKTGGNDDDRTGGDCISRQQAIDALKEKVFRNLTDEFYGAMQVLDELPSAQPEIIRCKDCKYYKYGICMKIGANKSFYGFCDWAERGDSNDKTRTVR